MEIKGTVQTTNNIDGTVASTRQISGTTNHSPIRWVDGEEVAELIEPVVREVIEGMALDSDVVLNASNVEGSTVTAALNKLAEGVTPASLTTDDITNLSDIEGTNVTNALNSIDTILDQNDTDIENLKTNKADKSEIPNVPEWALAENKPSYNSDEITNSSDVSGTTVSGALNQLNQNLAKKTSDDWVYTEFASGLKFCRCTKTVNITSWNAWGSVYETNNLFSRVFPFTFEKTPLIIANIPNNATLGTEINADATKINSLYMTRPNNAGITGNVELNIYVIGF